MKQAESSEKSSETGTWAQAIEHARDRLRKNQAQGLKIRMAIRTFERNLANGEPWPGSVTPLPATQSDGQDSDPQHSV